MSDGQIPQDPRNLIVNYIPTPVDDEELRQLFEQFGELESARVIIDRVSGVPKGYGFVKFKTEAAAREAILKMNGFEIKNKRLKVTTAKGPNATQMERQAHAQQQSNRVSNHGQAPPPPPIAPPPPPPPQQQITVDPTTGMAMIQVPLHQLLQLQGALPQLAQPQVLLAPMQMSGGFVAQQGITQYVPVIQTGGVVQSAFVAAQPAAATMQQQQQQQDVSNRR
mmetsp:Transcript_5994/g.6536  ORF Transcript_5994/g.6536 Transcript_5994/m.6536 type:complete len:223 (-) Transcript_5994:664-1332(-)